MDRRIIYDQSDVRDYDHLYAWRNAVFALGQAAFDLLGSSSTMVSGFAATPTGPASLTINLARGDIYEVAQVDATGYGSLSADTSTTLQQGFAAAQSLLLSTSGLSAGQSRWALVQATFTQTDDIPADDPTGGLLPYLDTGDPSGPPWSGPNNDGMTQNTRRKGVATISVIYGAVASTGTEVPPSASSGCVGLYLIDLAFGQTTITSGNILTAGPSVGVNVPSNYPQAPFLAGLLSSHHNGAAGQAPQINLVTEVQGVLPYANMAPVRQKLLANTTFFVATTGNDTTGNGTSGTPWATLQHALNVLQAGYDLNGFTATISVADGTYSVNATATGIIPGQKTAVAITGNTSTPTNCNIASSNFCITAQQGAWLQVRGFNLSIAGGTGACLSAEYGGRLQYDTCNFPASGTGIAHVQASQGGSVLLTGSETVSGGAGWHFFASGAGAWLQAQGNNTTVTGTPAFGTAFASSTLGGVISAPTYSATGSATGVRYDVETNGVINTSGGGASVFPGNSAGTTATGGQYV